MSKILKRQINIPNTVKLDLINNSILKVNGPLGSIEIKLPLGVAVDFTSNVRFYYIKNNEDTSKLATLHVILINALCDVVDGYSASLKMIGVGFKSSIQNKFLRLFIGFSHDVVIAIPDNLKISISEDVNILIKGYDRQFVMQFAKFIRNLKVPEPYKGKGIYLNGEKVIRKEGKKK